MVRPTAEYLDDLAWLGPTVTGLFVCLSSTMDHTYVRKRLDDKQRLWKNHAFGAKNHLEITCTRTYVCESIHVAVASRQL